MKLSPKSKISSSSNNRDDVVLVGVSEVLAVAVVVGDKQSLLLLIEGGIGVRRGGRGVGVGVNRSEASNPSSTGRSISDTSGGVAGVGVETGTVVDVREVVEGGDEEIDVEAAEVLVSSFLSG